MQATPKLFRIVPVDPPLNSGRQNTFEVTHDLFDGIRDVDGRLRSDTENIQFDRRRLAELRMKANFLKTISNRGDIAERHQRSFAAGHDFDLGKLVGPLFAGFDT